MVTEIMNDSGVGGVGRVPTGIEGFDDLVEGGFVRGDLILIAGDTGSGKTTLCIQFACNVSLKGERVLYASFEEGSRTLKRNMLLRGYDLQRLEDEGRLRLIDLDVIGEGTYQAIVDYLLNIAREEGDTIIVLDSISALLAAFEEKFEARTTLKLLYKMLKAGSYTTLATLSIPYGSNYLGSGVEEAISDGLILLENRVKGIHLETRLLIYKMRGTDHNQDYHTVIKGQRGISILPYVE